MRTGVEANGDRVIGDEVDADSGEDDILLAAAEMIAVVLFGVCGGGFLEGVRDGASGTRSWKIGSLGFRSDDDGAGEL